MTFPQATLKSINSPIFGLLGNNGLASSALPEFIAIHVVTTSRVFTI